MDSSDRAPTFPTPDSNAKNFDNLRKASVFSQIDNDNIVFSDRQQLCKLDFLKRGINQNESQTIIDIPSPVKEQHERNFVITLPTETPKSLILPSSPSLKGEAEPRSPLDLNSPLSTHEELMSSSNIQENGNNPTEDPVGTTPSPNVYYRLGVKLFLNKLIGLLLTAVFFSLALILKIHLNLALELLFAIPLFYLIYLAFADFFWSKLWPIDSWIRSENILQIGETCCCIWALIWIYLGAADLVSSSMLACVPFVLIFFFYIMISKAPSRTKLWRIYLQCSYIFQTSLISAKLDSSMNVEWEKILTFAWIYLVIRVYIWLRCAFCLIKLLIQTFFSNQREDMANKRKIKCLIWFFSIHGLSILTGLMLLGVSQHDQLIPDFKLISITASFSLALTLVLFFWTLLKRTQLTEAILAFALIENTWSSSEATKVKQQLKQIEKKKTYFVMLTSTYFLPSNKLLFNKRKDGSVDRIKKVIQAIKLGSSKMAHRSLQVTNIEALQKFKENFEKKFQNRKQTKGEVVTKIKSLNGLNKSALQFTNPQHHIMTKDLELKMKLSISVDNQERYQGKRVRANHENKGEALCYICYQNQPDAVFGGCGHGGMCHDCACVALERKAECIQCRNKVDGLFRIEVNPRLSSVFKTVEYTEVS